MKLIILAAGEGTRLRPYSEGLPKCMVQVGDGGSLLERQLEVIKSVGIFDTYLIGGYCWQELKKFKLPIVVNDDFKNTNMVWSLFCAKELLNSDVIISYGDIVYSNGLLEKMARSTADISVAVDLNWESYWRERNDNPLDDAESLKIEGEDKIIEIGKKPKSIKEIEGQYMGLMRFNENGLKKLSDTYARILSGRITIRDMVPGKMYMTDLLQCLIDEGCFVSAIYNTDYWVEVDTVKDLLSDATRIRLGKIKDDLCLASPLR